MNKKLSGYLRISINLFGIVGLSAAFLSPVAASALSTKGQSAGYFEPHIVSSKISHGTDTETTAPTITNNWGGYAVLPSSGTESFTVAKGTWVQPSITCYQATDTEFAPHWVGLDGYSSSTVEQAGVESSCTKGVIKYQAWFENFPKSATFLSVTTYPVTPGDTMFTSITNTGVSGTNTGFNLVNQDVTAGWTHTAKVVLPTSDGPFGTSAEWITEDLGGFMPDFGSVTFTGATVTDNSNVTGPISSFTHATTDITDSNNLNLVTPGSLFNSGYAFKNTWYAAQ